MILDVSDRDRFRPQAREDLEAWLALEGFEKPDKLVSIEIIGRATEEGFAAVVKLRPAKRLVTTGTFVKEYPPRSLWWYMTEGESK